MTFFSKGNKKLTALGLAWSLLLTLVLIPSPQIGAADHGDAPALGADRSADINDVYLFLDPADNNRVVILLTVNGFIVPAEAVNFGLFDHNLRYRFELEANGDAATDAAIDVVFSEKMTSGGTPQVATVSSTFFPTFTGASTPANLNTTGPTPTVTTDQGTGIQFFAGLADDPFFFDIPGFNRFVGSVIAGQADTNFLKRGRDSFAGYNTLAIGFSIPASLLRSRLNLVNNSVGVLCRTQRRASSVARRPTRGSSSVSFADIDRMGTPGINVALVPYGRKNEYNIGTPQDDAAGRYANSIVGTLTALGTNSTNIGILASLAVVRGDILRLDLTKANSGPGGGNNAGAGFPNGRRLGDDVIDTFLFFVANQNVLGDSVNSSDVPLRDAFPFFGLAHQPRESGTDDSTRN